MTANEKPANELAPLAIILTAIPTEYKAVREHLSNLTEFPHEKGNIYNIGYFKGRGYNWKVILELIGPGDSNAASRTTAIINRFEPDIILFVGVAGGVKDVQIGDVVVANKVYGYEGGKVADDGFWSRPEGANAAFRLQERAKNEAMNETWRNRIKGTEQSRLPDAYVGAIAVGEKVIASTDSEIYKLIKERFNDTLAVEMEGLGFLKAVHNSPGLDATVIRGISDLLNNKAGADEQPRQEIAAKNASAFAFELLAKEFQTYQKKK